MVNKWNEIEIGKLGRVVTGKTPPTAVKEYFGNDFPFITPGDMKEEKCIETTERGLSKKGADYQKTLKVPKNSIAVSCIGWQMGKSAVIKKDSFTNQQINTIIPDEKIVDIDYLYYALSIRRKELLSIGAAIGVRTPILNKSAFSKIKIMIPSIEIQKKVSSILSPIDQLISININKIFILEKIGELLFKHSFNDTLFLNPKDTLNDFVDFERGIEPGSKNYLDEERENCVKFIRVGDLNKRSSNIFIPLELSKGKIVQRDDIILSLDGSVGLVAFGFYGSYSTGLRKIVIKKELSKNFVYYLLKSDFIQQIIRKHAKGTTILHASSAIEHFKFNLPNTQMIAIFEKQIDPIMKQILYLQEKNEYLLTIKNRLIRPLVTNKIEVGDVRTIIPEVEA